MTKAIVLFSGGLDSLVTMLTLKNMGIDVIGLNIITPFHDVSKEALKRSEETGMSCIIRKTGENYADIVAYPRWGYGSAVNPCVDCRIDMLRIAKSIMHELHADFIATGEVVGQRPNSQKMHQLALIAKEAEVTDCLVRPLSAKALAPTRVELDGLINRERLHCCTGRSRNKILQLANEFGIKDLPQPASGCLLCEKTFAPRVYDLLKHKKHPSCWELESLQYGRVVRLDAKVFCVVARNANDCQKLVALFRREDRQCSSLLEPENFFGPALLLIGEIDESYVSHAGGLLLRFSNPTRFDPNNALIRYQNENGKQIRQAFTLPQEL